MSNSIIIENLRKKIFLKTNKTFILLFFKILLATLFIDTIVILSFSFVDYVDIKNIWFFNMYSFEENIFILALFFHLLFFIYLFILWIIDSYEIKWWKIIHNNWLFFKKRESFTIDKINTIQLYQSFFGKLFDFWDISIFYHEKVFILKKIPHPKEFIDLIEIFRE